MSYFNEELAWTTLLKGGTRMFWYDKGPKEVANMTNPRPPNQHKRLNNLGRCDGTYLYHIIKQYDDLADCTYFAKGNGFGYWIAEDTLNCDQILNPIYVDYPVHEWCGHNQVDTKSTWGQASRCATQKSTRLNLNVGGRDHFNSLVDGILGRPQNVTQFVYGGSFQWRKEAIRCYPKELYQLLLDEHNVGSNPTFGHIMERLWAHLMTECRDFDIRHIRKLLGGHGDAAVELHESVQERVQESAQESTLRFTPAPNVKHRASRARRRSRSSRRGGSRSKKPSRGEGNEKEEGDEDEDRRVPPLQMAYTLLHDAVKSGRLTPAQTDAVEQHMLPKLMANIDKVTEHADIYSDADPDVIIGTMAMVLGVRYPSRRNPGGERAPPQEPEPKRYEWAGA